VAFWYATGTVTVTNNSTTVTGSGTAWVGNVDAGEGFRGPNGDLIEIASVNSDTSLTLARAYVGTTQSGQAYSIIPVRGVDRRNQQLLTDLITSYQSVVLGIGAGLFPDGSAATPALRFTFDQDSGLFRAGENTVSIGTAGAGRLFVDGGGKVGIGALAQRGDLHITRNASGAVGAELLLANHAERSAGNAVQISFRPNSDFVPSLVGAYVKAVTPEGTTGNNCDLVFGAGGGGAPTDRFRVKADGTIQPGADATQNLGAASARWSTVYAGTGSINTSDERDKQWRGALDAAELRAAKRIVGELGIYQWNDAVEEKGEDGARLHFGVRAQQAFAILEDEGLDWRRYAWCCHDEWEGGDRYGIRPDQLAFWLIAAQAAIQADLDARIAALEAA
jgi:hypothetical protein